MIETSNAYKETVCKPNRTWKLMMDIYPDQGEKIELGLKDILMDSFSYNESSICSDTLDIGSTYANGIEFSLLNPDHTYDDTAFAYAKVVPQIGLQLPDNTFEYIPLGVFFVTDDGKRLSTIPLKALDQMYRLNVSVRCLGISLPNSTPYDILDAMATKFQFDITPETASALQTIPNPFSSLDDKITCRDYIGYCAAFLGKSARFNRAGKLEFFFVSDAIYQTTPSTRTQLTRSDLEIKVTGVQVTDAFGVQVPDPPDEAEPQAADDYQVVIGTNPLLVNAEAIAAAKANAYAALTSVTYYPYTCTVMGDPSVQCGDRICHNNCGGKRLSSIITGINWKLRGVMTLEAKGRAPEKNRQLTDTAKQIVAIRKNTKEDLNLQLTTVEAMIAKQTSRMTEALGFYQYIRYNNDHRVTGFFLLDNEDPDKAARVWGFTGEGIGISHTGINGPYTSFWSSEDSFLANIITADTLNTGVLKAPDGNLTMDLNGGKLIAQATAGTCTMNGNAVEINYSDSKIGKTVSSMLVTADAQDNDNTAQMQVKFSSKDGTVSSMLEQSFEYDADTHPLTNPPLRIASQNGVKIDRNLTVLDSIIYDNIKMQRKNSELHNTGIDFVFAPHPISPINLFKTTYNPGFEAASDSYAPWTLATGATGTAMVVTEQKHSGSHSLRQGSGQSCLTSTLLTPANNFYIGCWVRCDSAPATGALKIRSDTDAVSQTILSATPAMLTQWVYVSAVVENGLKKQIELYADTTGYLYWDDFFLCNCDEYSKEQLDDYVRSLYEGGNYNG